VTFSLTDDQPSFEYHEKSSLGRIRESSRLKRSQEPHFNYCIRYSSIFKRRQIYRTTPSHSYLSSGSVTIWSLRIRNGGATERPLNQCTLISSSYVFNPFGHGTALEALFELLFTLYSRLTQGLFSRPLFLLFLSHLTSCILHTSERF
jgi:hypothetical protein